MRAPKVITPKTGARQRYAATLLAHYRSPILGTAKAHVVRQTAMPRCLIDAEPPNSDSPQPSSQTAGPLIGALSTRQRRSSSSGGCRPTDFCWNGSNQRQLNLPALSSVCHHELSKHPDTGGYQGERRNISRARDHCNCRANGHSVVPSVTTTAGVQVPPPTPLNSESLSPTSENATLGLLLRAVSQAAGPGGP